MQPSKLYSTRTHQLPCGTTIALPHGVSVHRIKAKKDSFSINVRAGKLLKRLTANTDTIVPTLLKACGFLYTELINGWVPGRTVNIEKEELRLSYNQSIDAYSFSIGYPCLERLSYRRKTFYVGTSATKQRHIAEIRASAYNYRNDRIREYCAWFKDQLVRTINQLSALRKDNAPRIVITKLKIRLFERRSRHVRLNQEYFIRLPVHIELSQVSDDPSCFEISHSFKITIDAELFERYGVVQIKDYGTISQQARRLPGITGTDTKIEVWFSIKGRIGANGGGRLELCCRSFDCIPAIPEEKYPFEIKEIAEWIAITDFEIGGWPCQK